MLNLIVSFSCFYSKIIICNKNSFLFRTTLEKLSGIRVLLYYKIGFFFLSFDQDYNFFRFMRHNVEVEIIFKLPR